MCGGMSSFSFSELARKRSRRMATEIEAEILAKLKESRLATEGTRYRRQLSFGLTDLRLHSEIHDQNAAEGLPLSNKVLSDVFLPLAADTAFVAYFGHLMGYDAGYYGWVLEFYVSSRTYSRRTGTRTR